MLLSPLGPLQRSRSCPGARMLSCLQRSCREPQAPGPRVRAAQNPSQRDFPFLLALTFMSVMT